MKKTLIAITVFILLIVTGYLLLDEDLPSGDGGREAEALADKMLKAVNYAGWDTLTALKWTFRGQHHYIWDKHRNLVEVRWDKNRVLFNPSTMEGLAYNEAGMLEGEASGKLIGKAWSYFANDSFWLVAPFKVRDLGTERSLVKTEERDALLVKYHTGGVTPGDAYLWILDENGLPVSWKMWVSIIPFGGMKFSWSNWSTYDNEVKLAATHHGLLTLEITNIQTSNAVEDLNTGRDPFEELLDSQ